MENTVIHSDPSVEDKYAMYPAHIRPLMDRLRDLILEVAVEKERITEIHETLKWGEPSYLVRKGTTIRIDWKQKTPEQYGMFFQCTSKVVPTVKEIFEDKFRYDGSRAILFDVDKKLPEKEVRTCINLALDYHLLKDKPLLGHNS